MEDWYYGYADCNGLQYFNLEIPAQIVVNMLYSEKQLEEEHHKVRSQLFTYTNIARTNQISYGVVYRALLPFEAFGDISRIMNDGCKSDALNALKAFAIEIQLGTYGTSIEEAKQKWDIIPNNSFYLD